MDLSRTQQANVEFHRRLAQNYEDQPFFRPENRQRVRELLTAFSRDAGNQRLLDVGCGTGFILDLAHDLFTHLEGVDITEEMLEQVTPRPNVHTQLAAAECLPFPDQAFDVVTCYSLLHHLSDAGAVFKEARRGLKPNGVFYADESPSQHFRDALLGEGESRSAGELLRSECERVVGDVERYSTLYGIPGDLVREAMVQAFRSHGLREELLRDGLERAGFTEVCISYRRIMGEHELQRTRTPEEIATLRDYLTSVLPLSRHLFKYFVLVARA